MQGVAEIPPSATEAAVVMASAGLDIKKKVVKRSKAAIGAGYGATSVDDEGDRIGAAGRKLSASAPARQG